MSRSILIYIYSLDGGAGKNAIFYANTLLDTFSSVHVVCGRHSNQDLSMLNESISLKVFRTKSNLASLNPLRKEIVKVNPDVILTICASNLLCLRFALLFSGSSPLVILREANYLSSLYSGNKLSITLKKLCIRKSLKYTNHIVALTNEMKRDLIDSWGVNADKISVINNPSSKPSFSQEDNKFFPDKESKLLLAVGRLTWQKGFDYLLEAMFHVNKVAHCQLVIAGEGPDLHKLQSLAARLSLNNVSFVGHVSDVDRLYRSADLYILSSRFEGFPNAMIEAISRGVPVVSFDCPSGPKEIILDSRIGTLVAVGDVDKLAAAIVESLKTEYSSKYIKDYSKKFAKDKIESDINDVFRSV